MKKRIYTLVFLMMSTLVFGQVRQKDSKVYINSRNYPDTLNKQRLYLVSGMSLGAYAAGISFLSFVWYKDHEKVPFHYYDDSKGYLQMDKWGHAYAAYYESLVMTRSLRWAGVKEKPALIIGGVAGIVLQTPIEVFDGLYEGWGFSWSDMAANAAGSLLFTAQEAAFKDQIVRMKFSYSPSEYPDYHDHLGTTPIENFFYDYNAHTYWLSANLKKTTRLPLPPWLNFAFGYSANGMIYEFDNPTMYNGEPFPHLDRYRQFLFSLDMDLSKIETKSRFVKVLLGAANMIKVPFPTLEINELGEVKGHWIYF